MNIDITTKVIHIFNKSWKLELKKLSCKQLKAMSLTSFDAIIISILEIKC